MPNFRELVSVIIPTYNRSGTIARSVRSILNQDYLEIELIVVDDASTDNTIEILSKISDPRLKVITLPRNRGVSAATNCGVREAKGRYIAFQDSDDEWLDGKLSRQMERFLVTDESCVCVYCTKIMYGRDSEGLIGNRRIACVPGPNEPKLQGDLQSTLWIRNLVSPQTVLCRKSDFDKVGGFDEKLRTDQDWDFFVRLSAIGKFGFVDTPLVNTYVQSDSISLASRTGIFSQITVSNKMKRQGVPRKVLSVHWARLGYNLGKRFGQTARGNKFLQASLVVSPFSFKTWVRFLLNNTLNKSVQKR